MALRVAVTIKVSRESWANVGDALSGTSRNSSFFIIVVKQLVARTLGVAQQELMVNKN